MVQTVTFKH